VLFVGEFLTQHAPLEVSRLDPPNPVAHRRTALAAFDSALGPQAAAAAAQCSAWCVVKTHPFTPRWLPTYAHHDGSCTPPTLLPLTRISSGHPCIASILCT